MDRTILLSAILLLGPGAEGLRFAQFFQDGMVLQREPESATLYGFEELIPGTEAGLSCSLKGEYLPLQVGIPVRNGLKSEGDWMVELPPQEAGTVCDIVVVGGEQVLELNQVIFGDVWICSGQSNMVFTMKNIFNHTEEIAAAAAYTDIRFTVIKRVTSEVEEEDVATATTWTDPSNARALGAFSAVCFFYAMNVYDQLGVPMGLIDSAWGGTRVEAWSSQDALDACEIEDSVLPNNPQNSNSYLWNAMIHPLRKMTVRGFLWYQGEANANWNMDKYSCTFPTLISSWRDQFSMMSNTSPDIFFGFVMLSTIKYGTAGTTYPRIRMHQTADYGFVPNYAMMNTFMATAVDTYDEENGIHPRYKKIVGERLAYAGLSMAYGNKDFPSKGPIAPVITEDDTSYILDYDQDITFDSSELSGFFYCCAEDCTTTNDINNWPLVDPGLVKMTGSRNLTIAKGEAGCTKPTLAYLWRQTPIQKPIWGAPIYSDDAFRIPSPPWIWD